MVAGVLVLLGRLFHDGRFDGVGLQRLVAVRGRPATLTGLQLYMTVRPNV
jgi:hypothetical protein